VHATYELRDTQRDKVIPLRITWPKADGPHPLIVFCHGALGSKDGGDPMANHWASHGYVVIRPTFGDSISLMSDEQKKHVRSIIGLLNSPHVGKQWDQRPKDVKRVLNSLSSLEKNVEGLAGKIDAKRIAVAGHSYGAHTTMLLSGMQLEHKLLGKFETFGDKRIKASSRSARRAMASQSTRNPTRRCVGRC
jgi:predicted dienelactone hydrolase